MPSTSSWIGIKHGVLIWDHRNAACAVRDRAVTVPALAVKRLRARHDFLNSGLVAAYAVVLDDLLCLGLGAYHFGCLPGAEVVHIVQPGLALGHVVGKEV